MSNSNLAIYNPARVIVQGITGRHGRFHTERMLRYGTPLVAGTSPGKQGHSVHGLPVYSTIRDLTAAHGPVDASVIFVPPAHRGRNPADCVYYRRRPGARYARRAPAASW